MPLPGWKPKAAPRSSTDGRGCRRARVAASIAAAWRGARTPGRGRACPGRRASHLSDLARIADIMLNRAPGGVMRWAIILATICAATSAGAQDVRPPDPSTLQLPDMSPTRDPHVIADGWRHFYFHKA